MRQLWIANASVGRYCSIFEAAATGCLIISIWQAISGAGADISQDIEALE